MLNTQLPSQEAPDMDSAPTSIITSVRNPPLPCYSPSSLPPPRPLTPSPPPQFVPLEAEADSLCPSPYPKRSRETRSAILSYLPPALLRGVKDPYWQGQLRSHCCFPLNCQATAVVFNLWEWGISR